MSAIDVAIWAWCMIGALMCVSVKGDQIKFSGRFAYTGAGIAKLVAAGPVIWAMLVLLMTFGKVEKEKE